jgi:hypothetical protein
MPKKDLYVQIRLQRGSSKGVLFVRNNENTERAIYPVIVSPTDGIVVDNTNYCYEAAPRTSDGHIYISPSRNETYHVPGSSDVSLAFPTNIRKYKAGVNGSTVTTFKTSIEPVAIGTFPIDKNAYYPTLKSILLVFHEAGATRYMSDSLRQVNGIYLKPKIVGAFFDKENAYAVSRHDNVFEIISLNGALLTNIETILVFNTTCQVGSVLSSQQHRSLYIMCTESNSYITRVNIDTLQHDSLSLGPQSFISSIGVIDADEKSMYFVNR